MSAPVHLALGDVFNRPLLYDHEGRVLKPEIYRKILRIRKTPGAEEWRLYLWGYDLVAYAPSLPVMLDAIGKMVVTP